jgi:hypothetical protein
VKAETPPTPAPTAPTREEAPMPGELNVGKLDSGRNIHRDKTHDRKRPKPKSRLVVYNIFELSV